MNISSDLCLIQITVHQQYICIGVLLLLLIKTQRSGFGQFCEYITFTGNTLNRTITTYLDLMPGGTQRAVTPIHILWFDTQSSQAPLESDVLRCSRL